ncbi:MULTISPECIES: TetR/AcrR family transcriptional regulator [Mycobacteriales]|uniref:TetR/AcrR family transcriptional regulator n=1 Tax=Nocardia TaxID=1817 RepID=UPI0007EA58B3|nr:TetR/AcrR family transcriptional regulator [Nocardia nova]OBB44824.1 TetR family transcriptional regulator [Nocardia sp. 852002-51244_SCH5132740]OBF72160.1 TetR family transcriptional regulator [Mycobacterium sp. 852002-51759_SCH5129042]
MRCVSSTPALSDDEAGQWVDPRRARSRERLLDAATRLLATGGIHAVTVDAVTKASKVAATTLYRNFGNSAGLLAAAFERLLPQVEPPAGTGSLREQLTDLLTRQAALIDHTPIHLTALVWLGLGPTEPIGPITPTELDDPAEAGRGDGELHSLRAQVIDRYRQPFDQLLTSPAARAELGELDPTYAITQLVGPLVFTRLTGIHPITPAYCHHLINDFLTAHTPPRPSHQR